MSRVCVACGNTENVGKFCPVCGTSQPELPASQSDDPLIGAVISDRYEIVSLLNEGGMGRVYKSLHHALDRTVAIKVVHQHLLTSEEVISRFLAEARTVSRLQHPNVVSIFDFGRTGESDGRRPYIVMELLSGPDMSTLTESGEVVEPRRVVSLLTQVLAALADAHLLGITHRDIKPENIIIERTRLGVEHVKVIDFGIARVETDRRMTQANMLVGTPYYMAPEQVTQRSSGPAVDLYAVGVILFQLLTGRLPFDGATPAEILRMAMNPTRPDPRQVAPERNISDALAEVCIKSLALDPADRYPDAPTFTAALEDAGSTFSTGRFRPVGAVQPPVAPRGATVAPPAAASPAAVNVVQLPPAPASVETPKAATPKPPEPTLAMSAEPVGGSTVHAEVASNRESIPSLSIPPIELPPIDVQPPEPVHEAPVIPKAPRVPSVPSMNAVSVPSAPAPASQHSTGPVFGGSARARPPGSPSSMGHQSVRPPPAAPLVAAPTAPVPAAAHHASTPAAGAYTAPTASADSTGARPVVQPGRPRARSSIMVGEMPLVGRADELAWAEAMSRDPGDARGFVLRGRYGIGRTRLLRDVGLRVSSQGVRYIAAPARRTPGNEVGYGWLRRAIAALLDLSPTDGSLLSGRIQGPPEASVGVRAVFAEAFPEGSTPEAARAAVTHTLRWAAEWAVSRAPGGRVLLGIDDADHLPSADRAALAELLISPKIPGFVLGATAMRAAKLPSVRERELTGLTPDNLAELARTAGEMPAWPQQASEIEPLYVDLSRRWTEMLKRAEQPNTLRELVAWRLSLLVSARRQLLAAVAITGGDTSTMIAQIAGIEGDFDTPLRALVDAGFLEPRGEELLFRHGLFVELATEGMPEELRLAMHRRAGRALAGRNLAPELQAYHAIRAGADFEAFLKVDASARMRAARGDDEGTIASLGEGLRVARAAAVVNRDDEPAIDAWTAFARKLGAALQRAGRPDEALTVLGDARNNQGASDGAKALLLEQLSRLQGSRGRFEDAARLRSEAITLAERRGDAALLARLRGSDPPDNSPGGAPRTRRRTY